MKVAACVILYQPDKSVLTNIKSYLNFVDRIWIIDNSEQQILNLQYFSAHQSKIVFVHDSNNEGIAKRLNQACNFAINDGFEFLLTMDQDSYFEETCIKKYLECIENFSEKEKVGMFGINHQKQNNKKDCNSRKANVLITSGSIINLIAYKAIGDFDENLFIDFVDTDYCFRSILKGYHLIEFPNVFMHHEIGKTENRRSFKSLRNSNRSIHSAIRLYYMTRNYLYLKKKYGNQFTEQLSAHKKDLLNRIKNKLLYQGNRLKTIKFLLKAYRDFKQNKMGKQF